MKVGIITMFYDSANYGGILQSYATVKILQNAHIDAEQICYINSPQPSLQLKLKRKLLRLYRSARSKEYRMVQQRSARIKAAAMELIPHSAAVYTEQTLPTCVNDYAAFVTGSDQVWHGEWPAYFLSFVPDEKKKIAYAVSTGKSDLTEADTEKIRQYAAGFSAISVREADLAETLQAAMPEKQIELVLDPTLVLDQAEWDKIASPRKVSEQYLFCYFLGGDPRLRTLAKEYAARHGLKIVCIPDMQGRLEANDAAFGDVRSFDAVPQDFLSYIKYAEMIFTDSFHASVFSQIFRKQYIAFGRQAHKEMNNRLETLTELFGTRHRFLTEDAQFNAETLESVAEIDYSAPSERYEAAKERSVSFLLGSIQK